MDARPWKRDAAIAVSSGVGAALITGVGSFAIGRVTGGEARVLLEAVLPTSRFLCSAIITATATILALMLTLLSLSIKSETSFDAIHFHRIKKIAFYDMILLVGAACLLVLHCIPIQESKHIPAWWYPTIYHTLLAVVATFGGAFVSIVVMLYAAIKDLIKAVGLDGGSESRR